MFGCLHTWCLNRDRVFKTIDVIVLEKEALKLPHRKDVGDASLPVGLVEQLVGQVVAVVAVLVVVATLVASGVRSGV